MPIGIWGYAPFRITGALVFNGSIDFCCLQAHVARAVTCRQNPPVIHSPVFSCPAISALSSSRVACETGAPGVRITSGYVDLLSPATYITFRHRINIPIPKYPI